MGIIRDYIGVCGECFCYALRLSLREEPREKLWHVVEGLGDCEDSKLGSEPSGEVAVISQTHVKNYQP